jgi:Holliday junction resolvasome RuvABC endonuclease subunit
MIVVGLDVSLTCSGVAIVGGNQEQSGITTRRVSSPDLGDSLLGVRNRIRVAVDGLLQVIPSRTSLIVIEKPLPARSGFASLQLERGALYWWLVDQLLPRCVVVPVHPKTRAKLATGNGNATKRDVRAAVRADFPGVQVPDDNVADAVALAVAGARSLGVSLVEYSPAQLEAYGKVSWPEGMER